MNPPVDAGSAANPKVSRHRVSMRMPLVLSPRRVAARLASGGLQPREKLSFLLYAVLVGGVAWPIQLPAPGYSEDPDLMLEGASVLAWIAGVGVVFLGVRSCYAVNASID